MTSINQGANEAMVVGERMVRIGWEEREISIEKCCCGCGGQERNEKSKIENPMGESKGKSSQWQSSNKPMKQRWWEKEQRGLGGRYQSKGVVVVVVDKKGTKN